MARLFRTVGRPFGADDERLDSQQQQERCVAFGGTPCGDLVGRQRVALVGSLKSVTIPARSSTAALNAELCDGSGTVRIVWIGRRDIAGIHVGRCLRVEGLVSVHDGEATMYNPKYELLPS